MDPLHMSHLPFVFLAFSVKRHSGDALLLFCSLALRFPFCPAAPLLSQSEMNRCSLHACHILWFVVVHAALLQAPFTCTLLGARARQRLRPDGVDGVDGVPKFLLANFFLVPFFFIFFFCFFDFWFLLLFFPLSPFSFFLLLLLFHKKKKKEEETEK